MFAEILKNNDMTISDCARLTGMPKSTLADLTSGKTSIEKMSSGNLLKLSRCFGIKMENMYYYCLLPGLDAQEDFYLSEQRKISNLGVKKYISILMETEMLETCYKLNDMKRFEIYYRMLSDFYSARKQEMPEQYRNLTLPTPL